MEIDFYHPVFIACALFTILGILSLLCIGYHHLSKGTIMPNSGPFTVILTEDQIDNFMYEYQMVELTIEEIMKQVESQGYVKPDDRNETA
jgi:hypothetical protein